MYWPFSTGTKFLRDITGFYCISGEPDKEQLVPASVLAVEEGRTLRDEGFPPGLVQQPARQVAARGEAAQPAPRRRTAATADADRSGRRSTTTTTTTTTATTAAATATTTAAATTTTTGTECGGRAAAAARRRGGRLAAPPQRQLCRQRHLLIAGHLHDERHVQVRHPVPVLQCSSNPLLRSTASSP